jgi:hypothetical protein
MKAEGKPATIRRDWSAKAHFGLLALAPAAMLLPSGGPILIVPIAPAGEVPMAWASRAGARLIGPGPLPGSFLVESNAAQLWSPALSHGALLLRAGFGGCGVLAEK